MTSFKKVRTHEIPALRATVEEYVEPSSGARHIHLATDQADLAFLVAFPTIPDNSDGRAHILEHLSLSGSRRYPVRNPFFSMMRRSTASFMNAMTYADRTVYPFASTDRNDFFNLLDVYLDATFFPTLDYLNYRQEGWRYTIEDGKLRYQGVVLNEMKGAFTDPMRALYSGICAQLLKGTTYEVVSGGDPLDIPNLSHQMLKDFHASHYHPSQAMFMTAGPVAASEIQQRITERVLADRPGRAPRMMPQLASVAAPRQATIPVPSQAGRNDAFGIQFAWVLGESSDPTVFYHANLLQAGLLGDAAAPLRKAMESAGYGRPSRLNGMDPSARQMLFHVGMEGLSKEQVANARDLLWTTLERVAGEGVPPEALHAALRDITYRQRDTASGRMPNVLARMLEAVPVVMRGGDTASAFDSAAALERLHKEVEAPGFFTGLVRSLLDNKARLEAESVPDPDYFTVRAGIEQERLNAAEAALTPEAREQVLADSKALDELQRQPADTSLLPRIKPTDVSPHPRALPQVVAADGGKHCFSIASNGISYAKVQFDASGLSEDDYSWLQLYADLRSELGVGDKDYGQASAWCRSLVPQFGVGLDTAVNVEGELRLTLAFYGSALREEQAQLATVLESYIRQPRFDEHARIKFLVERMARRNRDGLAQDGDRYAALAAAAPFSTLRRFDDATGGSGRLRFVSQLQQLAASDEGVARIADRLAALHERILACPGTVLCAGSGDDAKDLAAMLSIPSVHAPAAMAVRPSRSEPANCALHAPSQVNHCHAAWPAPNLLDLSAPALAVAAELMSHQLLHQALREKGGAYGGRAAYMEGAGVFTMSSYRDPRLAGTYADFTSVIDQVLDSEFSNEQLEEAIICVIKQLDRSASPYDDVLTAWHLHRRGVDQGARERYRSGVLNCTLADIKAAVARWLKPALPSRAASVGNAEQDLAGLALVDLLGLCAPAETAAGA